MANVTFAYGTTTPKLTTTGFSDGCIYFNTSSKDIYLRQGSNIYTFDGKAAPKLVSSYQLFDILDRLTRKFSFEETTNEKMLGENKQYILRGTAKYSVDSVAYDYLKNIYNWTYKQYTTNSIGSFWSAHPSDSWVATPRTVTKSSMDLTNDFGRYGYYAYGYSVQGIRALGLGHYVSFSIYPSSTATQDTSGNWISGELTTTEDLYVVVSRIYLQPAI